MNENELKDLWNSEDSKTLPKIDFEQIEKNINGWNDKLHRRLNIEFFLGIVCFVAFIPISYLLPEFMYYLPIIAMFSVWYYWELWRIYKEKNESNDLRSTKEFLKYKTSNLTNFINRTRIITYSMIPFLAFSTLFFNLTFEEIKEGWIRVLILLIVLDIFAVAFCEIYFRFMYFSSIKTAKELLKQLESEN
ncbi:MAG: hypothetical protein ACR2MD_15010 [Aridibacter sp.]